MTTDTLLTQDMTPDDPQEQNPAVALEVPEKFKDSKTGEIRVDALLKSYLALEKRFSERRSAPPEHINEYCIDCSHGLFEADADINTRLLEKGFTQEQAQEVYDLAAERIVPMIVDLAAEFQAEREIDRLEDHFGGAEKWREISGQLLSFGQKNLPPEVLKGMASSYEGVMALYDMMTGRKTDKLPSPRAQAKTSVTPEDLQSLMRSPQYWREKDPSVIEKVTKGFQNLYGSR